jgi:glycosyltransferase involved in cell wall biosynthesis
MAKKLITIIIPAYNEEEALPKCLQRITKLIDKETSHDFEVLLVDDGSKDKTVEIIKKKRQEDKRFSYVTFSRNFGKEIAILAGLDYAKGDAVIFIDADLQDPPEVIPELIKYWEQGYDDVYAKRRSRKGESWLKKWTSKMYYRVLQKMSSVEIQKDTGDFRLLDRSCIEALKRMREVERNTKGMYSWIGFRKKGIYYQQQERQEGKSKWSMMSLVNLALNGIMSYTTAPLRLASVMGLIVSLVAFIYLIYIIIVTNLYGDPVQGYPTIMVTILFLGGVQLLSLGILGEYLGKVFNEVKGRPGYFINSYNGGKEKGKSEE